MLKCLESLRDLFSLKQIENINNWVVSNPINYATKLCEYTADINNELMNKSFETISKLNYTQFWREELQYDIEIEKEVREQAILRRQIQHLIEEYKSQELTTLNLSDEELIEIAKEIASLDFHYDIISDINAFQVSQKREKFFRRKRGSLLKHKRGSLINFRDVFRQLYSFHFKNLDDEHDLAYTNLRMIS